MSMSMYQACVPVFAKTPGNLSAMPDNKAGANALTFKGRAYVLHFALPNFFFHFTTAYGILRHAGIELGKRDFIGQV